MEKQEDAKMSDNQEYLPYGITIDEMRKKGYPIITYDDTGNEIIQFVAPGEHGFTWEMYDTIIKSLETEIRGNKQYEYRKSTGIEKNKRLKNNEKKVDDIMDYISFIIFKKDEQINLGEQEVDEGILNDLQVALGNLKQKYPGQYETIKALYDDGRTHIVRVAEERGVSKQAVSQQCKRALARLRTDMINLKINRNKNI